VSRGYHAMSILFSDGRVLHSGAATQIKASFPTSRTRTPPGHYMLFLLNAQQVPSVGAIVLVK
jgi:hypothetical protein